MNIRITAFIVVYTIILGILGLIWKGYVFSILWEWFVIPVFELPLLTLIQATSFVLLINFMKASIPILDYTKEGWSNMKTLLYKTSWVILFPALALLVGWLIQLY